MRPLRLELEGFTAFRDHTEVDFVGADLFALTGPTGAGKSSLIDAMTFALYGTVARYDDRRLVAPIISQGALEARVRLDFDVAGAAYSAVRVVRSTGEGRATTKEARLERAADGEVLAGDARAVTAAVEQLLGLGFEHFTTCVVLPQGEFDRFLHEERSDREQLLERLLALRQFREMAGLARSRASADQGRLDVIEAQLADLDADPARLATLQTRVGHLAKLAERIDEATPRLEELATIAESAAADVAEAERHLESLRGLAVPEEVTAAAERLEALDQELFLQSNQTEAAVRLRDELEARVTELDEREELGRVVDRWTRHEELAARVEKGREVVEAAVAGREEAETGRAGATEELERADAAVEHARRHDRAHEVRADLVVGEPCPVCERPVAEIPDIEVSDAVTAAVAERSEVRRRFEEAATRFAAAERAEIEATALLARLEEELGELAPALEGAPSATAAAERRAALDRLAQDLDSARKAAAEAEAENRRARKRRAELVERQSRLRQGFDEARGRVAALDPPAPGHEDLATDWAALTTWAAEAVSLVEARRLERSAAAGKADEERTSIEARIVATCEEMDLAVGDRPPGEVVAAAIATAEADLARLRSDLDRAEVLRREREALTASRRVADVLAKHLSAGRFTTWLLDEAIERLVAGATHVLRQLTGDAYSLTVDEDGAHFVVVDHANADARRSARTLSGGETFLASLALALALAEQVAELAGEGAPPLESVFLDEGFGSLDVETLDVVAAALEELGASGRMVGVVTHVRDLADRLPVRFEVRKGPHSATVERVER